MQLPSFKLHIQWAILSTLGTTHEVKSQKWDITNVDYEPMSYSGEVASTTWCGVPQDSKTEACSSQEQREKCLLMFFTFF